MAAQLVWDESMAQWVVAILGNVHPPRRVVVLAGVGHVGRFAIPARAARRGITAGLAIAPVDATPKELFTEPFAAADAVDVQVVLCPPRCPRASEKTRRASDSVLSWVTMGPMEQLPLPLPHPPGSPPTATAGQPPSLADLAEQFCQRHRTIENYLLVYAVAFGLLRRLHLDPVAGRQKGVGQLAAVLLTAAAVVGAPVAVTALLDEWTIAPIGTWAAVGVALGLLVVLMHGPLVRAIDSFLSLHRTIVDEAGLRRLIAWEQRWFRRRVVAPAAFLFSACLLFYLDYLEVHNGERPMAWGTALVGFLLLYGVGEIIYSVLLLALESYVLRGCQYQLYRLSPLDSVAMRRTIRGSSQIGVLVSLVATMFIVGFVVLLGDRPVMVTQVGLLLLGLAYVATLAGVLLPRLGLKAIVQAQKEHTLAPLQQQIDALAARIGELSEPEYARFRRLKEQHDTIRDAAEEVLPLRTLGRLFGALVLPTLTFVGSRFGESILQGLLHPLRH